MIKFISYLLLTLGVLIFSGCSQNMTITMEVPKQINDKNEEILVLYVPGLTEEEFLQVTPKTCGKYILNEKSQYLLIAPKQDKMDYTLIRPEDSNQSISIFVIGPSITPDNNSTWKYFFKSGYRDDITISLSSQHIIKLAK